MNTNGALSFDAYIQTTDFKRQIDEMERRIMGLTATAGRESEKIDQTFKRLGQLAAGYFSFNALSQLPMEIVKVRGEFQQLEIAFSTMLRSKAGADKLMGELVQTAATTPFSLKDVAAGAKQLLAYGSTAGGVVKEIRMLGDVASGVSVPIGDLIYLYGTLKTQGRAYAQDIRQFAGRGIPIYEELAKVLGVSKDKVSELVTAGKVGFPEVEKAFKNMTGAGGMFQGLMEAQSKSLTGLLSNLGDAWAMVLNDIGKQNQGWLSDAISGTTDIVKHYEEVLDVLKVLVATYGAYKTAVIAFNVVQGIAASMQAGWTALELLHFNALVMVEGAQKLLNKTMLANPYVLAATAIFGLIAAMVVYSREATTAEKVQGRLSDAMDRADEQASKEIARIEVLKTQIADENLSRDQRNKKLQELIAISPDHLKALTLDNITTAAGTTAINGYVDALKKKLEMQEIENELTASLNRQRAAEQGKTELPLLDRVKLAGQRMSRAALTGIPLDASAEYGAETAAYQKQRNAQIVTDETAIQTALKKRITANAEAAAAGASAEGTTQKAVSKTVEYYNDQIKALKQQQEQASTTRAEYVRYQTQIDAMEKARNRLTGQQTAAEKKAEKDADKVGPMGSLSYWENISKKAQEVIDKTPSSNAGQIARQNAIKLDADRKADAIRKSLVKKSFEEELEEKKKQYELYQKWVDFVDKGSADTRFADLKKEGATYLDYLNSQIAKLEARRDEGTISPDEATNLVSLTVQRDETTGKKSAIDLFRESLTKAQTEAKSLTDYLTDLKEKQDSLAGNNTDYGIEARRVVSEEINNAERDRKAQLQQFVQAVVGSEQQRLAITKRYSDLRTELEKESNGVRGTDYEQTLARINKAEKAELDDVNLQTAEASQAFKDLNTVIDAEGQKALKIRLTRLKAYLVELEKTVGKESALYKATAKEIKDTGLEIDSKTLDSYKTFASLAGELGDALSQVNGGLGNTGRLLSGIASQSANVITAFDKTATTEDKIAAGVQGVIGLVNILASSANERRKAEEEYYRSVTAQQNAYNIALNNQLGLQTELNENVFVKDFEGRLKDGVSKLNAANQGYLAAIAKLGGGQAKIGQGNAVDWSKVGQGVGSGAAIGASIGSAVPVIGTVVGGVVGGIVGGIVGLFGGKKKEDQFGALLQTYPGLVKKGADGWEDLDENLAQTLIDQNLVDENTKQLLQNTLDWAKQIDDARKQIREVISELAGSLGTNLRDALVNSFKEGTDAAKAFGDSVSQILEDMLSQLIFNQVFSKSFDELQKQMEASYAPGGDGSWIDDFGNFFAQQSDLTKQFYAGLEAAENAAGAYGLNVFKKTTTTDPATTGNTALSGSIKGVSEETASVLAGQINAIRIAQAEGLAAMRQSLLYQSEIAHNTHFLESIDTSLKTLAKDPLRAKGG